MADQLPINFTIPGENVIATYDYTDIADGEAKTTLYLYSAFDTDTSTLIYKLGKEQPHTHEENGTARRWIYDDGAGAAIEYNFDTGPLSVPRIVKGVAIFNAQLEMEGGVSGNLTIKLYHVDSVGTETQLGNTYGPATWTDSGGSLKNRKITIAFTIPKTLFSIGEKIRLEITMDRTAGGGGAEFKLYISPQNQGGTSTVTTVSTLRIPFEIEN